MSFDIHNYLVEYGPQYADFRVLNRFLEPLGWLVGVSPSLLASTHFRLSCFRSHLMYHMSPIFEGGISYL